MPQFFDRNNLPPEQAARWNWAVSEYDRILDANIDLAIEAMTAQERDELLAKYRGESTDSARSLHDYMREAQHSIGGAPGDSKSALFARLLDGKPALPYPPPTAFSYPWYAVVEKPGPFNVTVDVLTKEYRAICGLLSDETVVAINQCLWTVTTANDAARRLIELQEHLQVTATPEREGSLHHRYDWSATLIDDVLAAYRAAPEFQVRHGRWSGYRLHVGRRQSSCQRRYVLDCIAAVASRQGQSLSTCGSVFDLTALHLNTEIGEVVAKAEHPRERLEKARARQATGPYPGLMAAIIEQEEAELEQDIAEFEADPSRKDFVAIVCDDWVLSKSPAP